jgi:hypothetical protein
MTIFGFCPIPVIKFIVWQQGYRSVGVARRSRAAKIMKKLRGIIPRHSLYALAQSIGTCGFGSVRLMVTFLCGVVAYLTLLGFFHHPLLASSFTMIVFSVLVWKYRIMYNPISEYLSPSLEPYFIGAGICGIAGWLLSTGVVGSIGRFLGVL